MSVQQSTTESVPEEMTVLFQKTADNFVNEGMAELTRRLQKQAGFPDDAVHCTPTKIYISSELKDNLETILYEQLLDESNSNALFSYTHRLTTAALEVNEKLENDKELKPPRTAFPENETVSRSNSVGFANDELTETTLQENGLNPDDFDWAGDGRTVYSRSPSYTGNPSKANLDKVEDIIELLVDSLGNDTEDNPCECCGRTDLPTQEIEYNQGFALLVTKSSEKPLGSKSGQSSSFKGRCPTCLLAGWVYTMMRKPVAPIDVQASEYRVYGFTGGLDTLVDIRQSLVGTDGMLEDINRLTYTSIPKPNTRSRELETILLLGRLRESLQKKIASDGLLSGTELVELKPESVFSFYSCPMKSGNPVRNIKSVASVDVQEEVWELLGRQKTIPGETYYPVSSIFERYAGMYLREEETGIREKEAFGKGFRTQDLRLLSNGLFDLFKIVAKEESVIVSIKGAYAEHYFTQVTEKMTNELNSEELDSLKRMGKHIGEVFSDYDDVGTLSSLKNANTPHEFMRKMDTVASDAFKKGHHNSSRQYVPDSDEVGEFVEVILDEQKFDTAKHVFIIHATMAAQYQTMIARSSQSSTGDGE